MFFKKRRVFHLLIAVLAIANLVALFVFQYGIRTSYRVPVGSDESYPVTAFDDKSGGKTVDPDAEDEEDPRPAPELELEEDEIEIPLGSTFAYGSHVKIVEDYDGTDLTSLLETSGRVDTERQGTYKVYYSVRSPLTGKTASKTMTVDVI